MHLRRSVLLLASALTLVGCGDDATAPAFDVTLRSPLPAYTVLQGFVWNEQWQGYHLANDLVAAAGDTVRAAADGRVGFAQTGIEGYGGLVLLEHGAGSARFVTLYGHLSTRRGLLVSEGESVTAGEAIATVADDDEDGGPWGPHLHFGVRPGALDLVTEICGVWMYVGYTRSCAGWSHERFRAMWADPGTLVTRPTR